jgi:oligoendopeptidase F
MSVQPPRAEVPAEQTWNLADLFPTVAGWEAALQECADSLSSVTAFEGRLAEGPGVLAACLEADEAWDQRFIRVATFASLRQSEDGANPENQALLAKVQALGARAGAAMSFIRSEVLAIPDGIVAGWIDSIPALASFRRPLEDLLAEKPHILAPETEKTLAALGEVLGSPYAVYQMAKSADMRFPAITGREGEEIPMSFAQYEDRFEESADTELRRRAYDAFSAGLAGYKNTSAATFAIEVKKHVAMARIRGFASAEHMLLHPQQVSHEAYTNLLDIIQAELAPHMRRLMRLRKRVLGLDRIRYCDLKAPLDPEYRPTISFEEAGELIATALRPLGEEHNAVMRRAVAERWVDRAQNAGKSTGAFCSSPYGVHPYILLTWADSMRSAFVLAHELGHAGHFALAGAAQRLANTRPSMFFIECPSTMNELLLGQHVLATSTDARMRRWVILQFLGTYHHNFVTHLLEGELQRRVYARAGRGEPVTAAMLCHEKGEVLESFWGGEVEIDDAARLTWMRQPHYYLGLYPYTYSAGLCASTAIAQLIRDEGQPAIDRYLAALRAGGTLQPLDLFALAGVDYTTPAPIRAAVAYVGGLVDELERSFA